MQYFESSIIKNEKIGGDILPHTQSWSVKDSTIFDFFCKKQYSVNSVLDVGCGNGSALNLFSSKLGATSLCGVDLVCYLLPEIKNRVEFKVVDINFEKLPWADNSFNVVSALQTAEHLENPFLFMREAWRVLKNDGIFVLSVPNINNVLFRLRFLLTGNMPPWSENNNHLLFLTDDVFKKTYLKKFKILKVVYQYGDIPFWGRFSRLFSFLHLEKHGRYLPRSKYFGRRVCYFLQK